MSTAQASAFKHLYSEVFRNNGDVSKVQATMKNNIKCYVKESFPYFLVADNFFYVPCYFTKKAVEGFKSKTPNTNITDLKGEVILITEWSLELARADSAAVFTSYAGVELRLIVKGFKPMGGKDKILGMKYPSNIYRDNEMKTLIQSFVNGCQASAMASGLKGESLPDIAKFSGKANVAQGVVSFASGDSFTAYGFKEAKTPVVDMASIYKSEKGAVPAKAAAKSARPKVSGGAKKSGASPKKATGGSGIAAKLAKFTPGGKKTIAKKSTKMTTAANYPSMASPGEKMSEGATAEVKTMKQFKKMVEYIKKIKQSKKGGKKSKK